MCHPGGISIAGKADDGAENSTAPVRHSSFYTSPARLAEKNMLLDASLSQVLARYGAVQTFS